MKQEISKKFMRWYKEYFKDKADLIDVAMYYDSGISPSENQEQFKRKFGLLHDNTQQELKETVAVISDQAAQQIRKEEEQLLDEEKRVLEGYTNVDGLLSSPGIEQIKHRILMIIKKHWVGTIISSQGGMGKTHIAMSLLNKHYPNRWEYIKCKTTPLQNYINLYENRNKEIILYEDVEGLESTNEIMKSATDDAIKKRIIQYNSTKLPKGIPSVFEIKARIIWLTNNTNIKDDALKRRFTYYYFNPSHQEKMLLLKQLSQKKYKKLDSQERNMIYEFIQKSTDPSNTELNLRTLFKAYEYYLYDKKEWKKILLQEPDFTKDQSIKTLLEIEDLPIKEQITRFNELTRKSRATYYRTRQRIAQLIY